MFPMGFPAGSDGLQVVWDVFSGADSGRNDPPGGGGLSGGDSGRYFSSGGGGGGGGSVRSLSSAKLYQSQPFALAGRWWYLR